MLGGLGGLWAPAARMCTLLPEALCHVTAPWALDHVQEPLLHTATAAGHVTWHASLLHARCALLPRSGSCPDLPAPPAPCAAGIAAYGCIKALNTLLESVSSLKHLFPALEELLYPLMKANISTDGQDVFEEVLEMLAYFTYFSDSISPRLWSLWPQVGVSRAAGQQGRCQ